MIRLCFVVEVTTDVRMVDGLGSQFDLTVLGKSTLGRKITNHPPSVDYKEVLLPANRGSFGPAVFRHLVKHKADYDFVIVTQYGVAALGVNLASRCTGVPSAMLVCSPSEAYYACRKTNPVARQKI